MSSICVSLAMLHIFDLWPRIYTGAGHRMLFKSEECVELKKAIDIQR
jgi:hypothetical protein